MSLDQPIFKTYPKTYIIAEVGLNHNGNLSEAKYLIREAAEAGANGIKIQVRDLDQVYTQSVLNDSLKAEQGTQYILDELKKSHLSYDQVKELFDYARDFCVDFFGTPFDLKSANFLNQIGTKLFKIGSPDFTNLLLIDRVVSFGKPLILSTGMCTEDEIKQVTEFLNRHNADYALLHCNSSYPASSQDINLRYIPELRKMTNKRVGYSGHEQGYAPTIAAIGLGASIIERHITRSTFQDGPDHTSSLSIDQFKQMVQDVRTAEESLGLPIKNFCQGEKNNRLTLGKSLVASTDLKAGTFLKATDLNAKSPAKGLSPLEYEKLIGKQINRDIRKDDYFFWDDLQDHTESVETFAINRNWGIVGRLNDFKEFLDIRPKLVEIHLTWRDLLNFKPLPVNEVFDQDLVVHAPEYYQDKLIDFTTDDPAITEFSTEMLRQAIDLARKLSPQFNGLKDPRGPRVVVHPGGHFPNKNLTNKAEQYRNLVRNLKGIQQEGVRLLVENMPPYPWYFGGQWHQTVFMDSKEISEFAKSVGWGICYDTSHALLYCNSTGASLRDFSKEIYEHIHYMHLSDAKGVTEEGLQLGLGNIDFDHLFELIHKLDVGFIPEIWQGHLNKGRGFKDALATIETLIRDKISQPSCPIHGPNSNCNHS